MLLLVGPIPIKGLPLALGRVEANGQGLMVGGHTLDVARGAAAMMSAAHAVCQEYGLESPTGVVAGDTGNGAGSAEIYKYLTDNLSNEDVSVITLHYIMPDIARNKKFLKKVASLDKKPTLIADAGGMFVAKTGGDADYYDVFTPDAGEIAFLADEKAPHPGYTRGFIFHMDDDVPELIRRAYESKNAARTLFVKGNTDYVCQDGQILETISEPKVEELEPIGGTGDTITGMVSALIYAGKSPVEACQIAGEVNWKAGELCRPTPATQVEEIIKCIPAALKEVL